MFNLRGGVRIDPSLVSEPPIHDPGTSFNDLQSVETAQLIEGTKVNHGPVVPRNNEYLLFDRSMWLTLGDGDGYQAYYRRKNQSKHSVKWGQLKLLATEIQFLTLYWDPQQHRQPVCLYVGAAPGTHLISLLDLFPWFTFHLYDPREFDFRLKTHKNVVIHQEFFGESQAQEWATKTNVFFICDIRTSNYERLQGNESIDVQRKNEELVRLDMENQQSWTKIIKPIRAHLKFRLPYTYDFVKAEGTHRTYLDGLVYRQAWASQTSTETRLVPGPELSTRSWILSNYEDGMFYANNVVREQFRFTNPFSGGKDPIAPDLGLTNDYDSALFINIVREYLIRFGGKGTYIEVHSLAKKLIKDVGGGRKTLTSIRSGALKPDPEDED
jgi:hypothetical protein